MNQNYIDTVRPLLAIAPAVFASGRFAMKSGTALNLFVQEMPRLSVDIDLVFVDHRPVAWWPRARSNDLLRVKKNRSRKMPSKAVTSRVTSVRWRPKKSTKPLTSLAFRSI